MEVQQMDIQLIKQIGKCVGLEGARLKRYIHFFSSRFPDESNEIHSYAEQWAVRFKVDPARYMDKESLEVFFSYCKNIQSAQVNYEDQLLVMSEVSSLAEYKIEVEKLGKLYEWRQIANFLEVLANAN